MIKLDTVIQKLSDDDYETICIELKKNNANKFLTLFNLYRDGGTNEKEMAEHLGVSKAAFYTLKSRLTEKIQEYLFNNVTDTRASLLKNVANINHLLYNSPKDTSIAILKKLELELRQHDMPAELISVYGALKKLHLHTPKYFEYSQHYNKHVAYTLALDKADDLISTFTKILCEYYLSRNEQLVQTLYFIKAEMQNVSRLYQSHHLRIYKNLIGISYNLFIKAADAHSTEDTIEEMLDQSFKIFDENKNDMSYQYLRTVFHFLAFEYYISLKLFKNAKAHHLCVLNNLNTFLLANHCTFVGKFLISNVEYHVQLNIENELYNDAGTFYYQEDADDVCNYICYNIYKTCIAYYSGKYMLATKILNNVLNTISFKNLFHIETEIRLFLALCYSMENKYEQTELIIKRVSRKITDTIEQGRYENAVVFIKILRTQMNTETTDLENKIRQLCEKFMLINKGNEQLLCFLKLDNQFIKKLSKGVK